MLAPESTELGTPPSSSTRPRHWPRLIGAGIGFFCGLAGQMLSHALLVKPAEITSIWAPGGLVLAALITRPIRLWPSILAGFVAGGVLAFAIRTGMVLPPFLGYLWISLCLAAGACAIRPTKNQSSMFPTIKHLIRFFLIIVVGVSVACSTGFVAVVALIRSDISLPRLWMLGTAAFAVGFMLLTPLAVDLQKSRTPLRAGIQRHALGFVLLSAGLWLTSIIAWHAAPSNLSSIPLVLFAPIPLLMLAAFQFGTLGPSVGLLVAFVPAIIVSTRLDKSDTFDIGFVNSYIMQLWALAAGILVHALSIQSRQRDDVVHRLMMKNKENRNLAARLIRSQEEQSIRISRELHDEVNQKLTFYSIVLSSLKSKLPIEAHPDIDEIATSIRTLIGEVRHISHSLHPAVLEHVGLSGALDELVRSIESHWNGTILMEITVDPSSSPIDGERALCMYRVAQESVRNAIEHSDAETIKIAVSAKRGLWNLEVSDDGQGFEPDSMHGSTGLGLLSMRERVASVGGTLTVKSRIGVGTSIIVELAT